MQKSPRVIKLPGDHYTNRVRARFWLTGKNDTYIGVGRIQLLENINELGSINKAAKSMKMSYRKAWRLVEGMNTLSDEPLVIKEAGGAHGGGTHLTPAGHLAIKQFRAFEVKMVLFIAKESANLTF